MLPCIVYHANNESFLISALLIFLSQTCVARVITGLRHIKHLLTGSSNSKLLEGTISDEHYKRLLIRLDMSIEYPLMFLIHPVTRNYSEESIERPPSLGQLLAHASFLLFFDCCCEALLPRFGAPSKDQDRDNENPSHCSAATDLANEYAMPRATMLLAPVCLERIAFLRQSAGRLHFLSVIIWLCARQSLNEARL